MKSKKLGRNTSKTEVLNISPFGVWIYVADKEHFLPYDEYPWFRQAPIAAIQNIHLLHENHLYWPDLDVDLEVSSLNHPEQYSLLYS